MTADTSIDAASRELDQRVANVHQQVRARVQDAGIDVDEAEAAFDDSVAAWATERERLRAALLQAFAGDMTALDALAAPQRSRADDDTGST